MSEKFYTVQNAETGAFSTQNASEYKPYSGGGSLDPSALDPYAEIVNVDASLALKQDKLVSGTNIKTINNESILGSGNITIESTPDLKTINNESILGEGNISVAYKVELTQAEYDALSSKDPNAIYVITDSEEGGNGPTVFVADITPGFVLTAATWADIKAALTDNPYNTLLSITYNQFPLTNAVPTYNNSTYAFEFYFWWKRNQYVISFDMNGDGASLEKL